MLRFLYVFSAKFRLMIVLTAIGGCLSFNQSASAMESDYDLGPIFYQAEKIRFIIAEIAQRQNTHQEALPELSPLNLSVENAPIHSIFFQSAALFSRADELAFEQLRQVAPIKSTGLEKQSFYNIDSIHTVKNLQKVENVLNAVARKHQLSLPSYEFQPQSVTAEKAFLSVLNANREIDQLLQNQVQPSDVYQRVTQSINISVLLLNHFNSIRTVSAEPDFIEGKEPVDVWLLLHQHLEKIHIIAQKYGYELALLNKETLSLKQILPRDVYQIATTVLAELAYLHHKVGADVAIVESVKVVDKTPSDVYQKASMLSKQLELLLTAIQLRNAQKANQ